MNIIELAKQAGIEDAHFHAPHPSVIKQLQRFAALVAAQEREECAKLCEAVRETIWAYHEEHLKAAACNVCTNLAISIRARGTT